MLPRLTIRGLAALPALLVAVTAPGAAPSPISPALTEVRPCPGVSVYPSEGTPTASPTTQISLRGIAARSLTARSIRVTGSLTGGHSLRLVADSDGEGASFFPSRPFSAGETVTVTAGFPFCGGRDDTVRFGIATTGPPLAAGPIPPAKTAAAPDLRHFVSRPDLEPSTLIVSRDRGLSAGDVLLTPTTAPGNGPTIVDARDRLVWFRPLPRGETATNLRVQRYRGQPVLTWWQGAIDIAGHGVGVDEILNDRYQHVATVRAGNGYQADLHDFVLDGDTAWLTAYNQVGWDMTSVGGPVDGSVWDCVVQQIDVPTGNVLFEWHSLGHVAVDRTYLGYAGLSPFNSATDYFHVNAISPQPGGTVLISSRNTDAAYEVRMASGNVLWTLGGKRSSFRMGPLTFFRLQHDVEYRGGGLVTIFDDEDQPPGRLAARGLELELDLRTMTARLVHQWVHQKPLTVASQGDVEVLPDGNVFVGWGAEPFVTEFTPSGRELYDAHLPTGDTYRAYLAPWSAEPSTRPAVAAVAGRGHAVSVYASWNGATGVTRWQLLAGERPASLRPVKVVAAVGFETRINVTSAARDFAVRAIGAHDALLRASPAVRPRAAAAAG